MIVMLEPYCLLSKACHSIVTLSRTELGKRVVIREDTEAQEAAQHDGGEPGLQVQGLLYLLSPTSSAQCHRWPLPTVLTPLAT